MTFSVLQTDRQSENLIPSMNLYSYDSMNFSLMKYGIFIFSIRNQQQQKDFQSKNNLFYREKKIRSNDEVKKSENSLEHRIDER